MAISDLYASGQHKQEIGHFASIVKIAKTDNIISEGEKILLDRAAKKLHISAVEYEKILENPEKFPVNPPVSYEERIERLHRLTRMVFANDHVEKEQVHLLRKIAVALHFSTDNIDKICSKAIQLVARNSDLETFSTSIKEINH
ncbi:fructose 1,6-bisphosphatase [Tenacibaculum sp. SG-28]|uniref:fructose 1,6-bisphosphatase n=1 Tax=Tenacibaculum sp. SG-28 TaxID=754426 RepID=UPI000CF4D983|nr:fructose 1,6-bisphosphatase [Tenacibaculum sp. SG-28]PQJ21822.1 hypothetical protein BSU00_07150 [Tenacibaculum sp. SG-28]